MSVTINACTFASDAQFHFVRVSVLSFIQHNRWFSGTVYLIIHPDFPLSEANFRILSRLYPNLSQVRIERAVKFTEDAKRNRATHLQQIKEYCKAHVFSLNESNLLYFSNSCLFMKDVAALLQSNRVTYTPEKSIFYIGTQLNIFDLFLQKNPTNIDRFLDEEFKGDFCEQVEGIVTSASNVRDTKFAQLRSQLSHASCIFYNDAILNDATGHQRIKQVWLHKNKEVDAAIASPRKINYTLNKANLSFSQKKANSNFLKVPLFSSNASSNDPTKIALCTVCNDLFINGTKVLLYSFLVNNSWFNQDIIIFYSNHYSSLSDNYKNELMEIYDKIIFMEVNEHQYFQVISNFKKMPGTNPRFIPSLFTFESFDLASTYDKILYLDSDMLVRSDVSELFSLDCALAVTPDSSRYTPSTSYERFNGGFILIDGKLTRDKNYKRGLIELASSSNNLALADQTVMNSYFKKSVTYLSSQYNCLKRCFPDQNFKNFDPAIKIIHYVGAKPWQNNFHPSEKKYSNLEKIWKTYEVDLTRCLKNKKNTLPSNRDKILILTSSFEGDLVPFSNEEFMVFSTNWGICHGITIDYYFCSADEPELVSKINANYHLIKKWLITDSIKNKLCSNIDPQTISNIFDFFSTRNLIGKFHVLPKSRRGNLNLPTSGVQMICAAADFSISQLSIRGVNLYSMKNSNGGYKLHGNTYLENPYNLSTKPHDLATDLGLLYLAFKKLVSQSIEIDTDAPILNDLLELVKKDTPVHLCQEIISKKYY